MADLLIYNGRIALPDCISRGGVFIRDGSIKQVFAAGDEPAGISEAEKLDARDSIIAPGLIDLHIHGSAGVDALEADGEELGRLSEFLLSEGVTGYFATLPPAGEKVTERAVAALERYIPDQDRAPRTGFRRARLLGIHFEGPFLSASKCGALRAEHFHSYDEKTRSLDMFVGGDKAAGARLMTVAPEVEGGLALTRELTGRGVRVFIGHSAADLETLDWAFERGARHITHFPNALDSMHHRKPGAVGWALTHKEVTLDLIADLHHVHPLMMQLIVQSKGADRVALITDAIQPAGLGDGEFEVWGEKILVRDGRTALGRNLPGQTLAGSLITLRRAVKNMVSLGMPLHRSLHMASLVPARVAGLDHIYGSISEDKRADLVLFDDELAVRSVVVSGRRPAAL
jgi:N-acetylglucosamine-6-phosphate deacetylase